MGNRRVILFLLAGIAVCALLLWGAQRRVRFFPAAGKTKAVLVEHVLDGVDRLTVERGDARIGLRKQGGLWEMEAPFAARVDQGAVARLLDAFESERVTDALSFQELRRRELSLKEFGLAAARTHVVLSGPQQRDEFLFGAFTPLGSEVYVRMNGLDQVLVVPSGLYGLLPRTADDLRSRRLAHGNRALLRSIELRVPGKPFIKLSKETGTWRLVQPSPAPASDAKVESLLDVVYGASVARFVWPTVSNVMDVAESESALRTRMELYGFGADTGMQLQVQEAGSSQPSKIVFGRPLDGDAGLTYILLPGGDAIGAVSNSVADAFRVQPAGLRDTRLFSELPGRVRRLQVYFGDLLYVLTQTNSLWRLEAPVSDVADQAVVKETVERLLRLDAESVDEGGPEGQPRQRADSEEGVPLSHVELFTEQDALRFMVAPDDVGERYLRITFTNAPAVFRVAASNVPPALVSMVGLLSLRDKTVLALPKESLRRITLKREGGAAEAVERETGAAVWRLGEGQSGRLMPERLSALLGRLSDLKADRIEKLGLSPGDPDAYGLRAPWLEVSVDVDAVDTVRKTVLVGKEAGFGKRYAMVRGLDVLFVLSGETVAGLSARLVETL